MDRSARDNEPAHRVGDQLDRDGRQQQAGDTRQQHDAALPDDADDATENRSDSHSTRCTATSPAAIAATSADPCARRTNTMVATMAPGPASSGVPKGTSACLLYT